MLHVRELLPQERPKPKKSKRSEFEDLFASQVRAFRLPEPIRQFRFAPPRLFKADFAWKEYWLLLEVEGGIWLPGGGAHSHPLDIQRDIERRQYAVLHGFYILPVTTDQVKNKAAIAIAQRALVARGWTPP